MKFILERLDRRHTGYQIFSHRAWIRGSSPNERKQNFILMREWCWENFGPGCERDLVWYNGMVDGQVSYQWAFHYEQRQGSLYIYLREELLTAFLLKWN